MINIDGITTSNPHLIANHFNQYFTNVRKNLSDQIPSNGSNFKDYLSNPNSSSIFLCPVTEEEVIDIVNNFPNKRSAGFDLITSSLLKGVFHAISKPLTYIINMSISSGVVPDDMKIARITPIFKSGNPGLVNNYRPISVLSSFSKILERIVYKRIIHFLDGHSIITDAQFGFREHQSTSHAVI